MSGTIIWEWYFLLYSIITGVGFAYIYDNIRLFRRIFKHKRWLVDIEDILYWVVCFFVSFYLLYYGNHGVVRFFAVIGAGTGMYLYAKTIGKLYVKSLYCLIMQIAEEEARTEELKELETYTKTKKYAEEVAKDKLGLVYENEIIFQENK